MMKFLNHFALAKAQRNGFFILIILILIIEFGFYLIDIPNKTNQKLSNDEKAWLNAKVTKDQLVDSAVIKYQNFNPNQLTKEAWQNLGFSPKQSEIIIKYKYALGGNFTNLKQIKNCYVISDAKFKAMKPFMQLSPVQDEVNQNKTRLKKEAQQKKLKSFDPNELTIKGWMDLGFSEKQAKVILNYKNKVLKGRFSSLAQIKDCFVISDAKFLELKPWVVFSHKNNSQKEFPSNPKNQIKNEIVALKEDTKSIKNIQEIKINLLLLKDWINLGLTQDEAANVLKYKEFIGGFKSIQALQKCKYLNPEVIKRIKTKKIIF